MASTDLQQNLPEAASADVRPVPLIERARFFGKCMAGFTLLSMLFTGFSIFKIGFAYLLWRCTKGAEVGAKRPIRCLSCWSFCGLIGAVISTFAFFIIVFPAVSCSCRTDCVDMVYDRVQEQRTWLQNHQQFITDAVRNATSKSPEDFAQFGAATRRRHGQRMLVAAARHLSVFTGITMAPPPPPPPHAMPGMPPFGDPEGLGPHGLDEGHEGGHWHLAGRDEGQGMTMTPGHRPGDWEGATAAGYFAAGAPPAFAPPPPRPGGLLGRDGHGQRKRPGQHKPHAPPHPSTAGMGMPDAANSDTDRVPEPEGQYAPAYIREEPEDQHLGRDGHGQPPVPRPAILPFPAPLETQPAEEQEEGSPDSQRVLQALHNKVNSGQFPGETQDAGDWRAKHSGQLDPEVSKYGRDGALRGKHDKHGKYDDEEEDGEDDYDGPRPDDPAVALAVSVASHWGNITQDQFRHKAIQVCKAAVPVSSLGFVWTLLTILFYYKAYKAIRALSKHPWTLRQQQLRQVWRAAKRSAAARGLPPPPPPPGLVLPERRQSGPRMLASQAFYNVPQAVPVALPADSGAVSPLPVPVGGQTGYAVAGTPQPDQLFRFVPGRGFVPIPVAVDPALESAAASAGQSPAAAAQHAHQTSAAHAHVPSTASVPLNDQQQQQTHQPQDAALRDYIERYGVSPQVLAGQRPRYQDAPGAMAPQPGMSVVAGTPAQPASQASPSFYPAPPQQGQAQGRSAAWRSDAHDGWDLGFRHGNGYGSGGLAGGIQGMFASVRSEVRQSWDDARRVFGVRRSAYAPVVSADLEDGGVSGPAVGGAPAVQFVQRGPGSTGPISGTAASLYSAGAPSAPPPPAGSAASYGNGQY